MSVPLESVLSYSNRFVIERFAEKNSVSLSVAEEVFTEMLKMLWLMETQRRELESGKISSPKRILVFKQMAAIDDMWHAFILFSREYTEFCEKYFGHYIHHVPTTSADRQKEEDARLEDPEGFKNKLTRSVEAQCVYIADKLGAETLTKWYKDFPARFALP